MKVLLNDWLFIERKVLIRVFGRIKANKNWRKRYNKELMYLSGDLDISRSVRKSRLNWIGYFDRMDSKRKVSQVYIYIYINKYRQRSRLRERPENRWWNCVKTGIDTCDTKNWKENL
jgi:hypothetical protein